MQCHTFFRRFGWIRWLHPSEETDTCAQEKDTNVDGDECSDSDTQSEEVAIQGDAVALLDKLLKMVRPCEGRGRDVRKVVQNLKKSLRTLQNQVNSAHSSCPDADNTPCAEVKA